MAGETVTLATLIRGKNYKHFHDGSYVEFLRNIPKQVSDELAGDLEELIDTVGTDDGNSIEVDKFRIERNVPASRLEDNGEPTTRVRRRIVSEVVPVRKPPALRKLPKSTGKTKVGFGRRNLQD